MVQVNMRTMLAALAVLVAIPLFALWPALSGPFLFDDFANLDALAVFGEGSGLDRYVEYLTAKGAGPTGRPLSMLSFLLNDVAWPAHPFWFKYTNLMIHVINGLFLYWLVLAVIRQRFKTISNHHAFIGVMVAGFWVL
ncbi:MAG: tetratricopeptide repeat protein, partial [Marinobacter sp.]|nr:tetratricopeptide repeat protein [Marinobacter sp.]